jgi:hypothetical protein
MRSFLFILFSFFVVGIANAQGPTITAASEAVPGDLIFYKQAQNLGVALPAAAANQTWDYTGLIDSGGYEIDSFSAPSSTPYASLFPGTNLALNTGDGGYLYFKTTTNEWSALGLIAPGSDTTFYRSGLDEFHFPFSFGSSNLDSTEAVGYISGGLRDSFETVVLQQGAGYGTLKTPTQTYTNVLMQKTTTTQRFSPFYSPSTSSYLFVTPTKHSFIMRIDLNAQNAITKIQYATTGIVIPTSFTFTGTGNWNTAANWDGGIVPVSPIPSGTQVTINPQPAGSCTLNVSVFFSSGATLTVAKNAVFNVMGNLTIAK